MSDQEQPEKFEEHEDASLFTSIAIGFVLSIVVTGLFIGHNVPVAIVLWIIISIVAYAMMKQGNTLRVKEHEEQQEGKQQATKAEASPGGFIGWMERKTQEMEQEHQAKQAAKQTRREAKRMR